MTSIKCQCGNNLIFDDTLLENLSGTSLNLRCSKCKKTTKLTVGPPEKRPRFGDLSFQNEVDEQEEQEEQEKRREDLFGITNGDF